MYKQHTHMYIYTCMYIHFEGVCLTTVMRAPGASQGGLGPLEATGQVALRADPRDPADPADSSARPFFLRRLRT